MKRIYVGPYKLLKHTHTHHYYRLNVGISFTDNLCNIQKISKISFITIKQSVPYKLLFKVIRKYFKNLNPGLTSSNYSENLRLECGLGLEPLIYCIIGQKIRRRIAVRLRWPCWRGLGFGAGANQRPYKNISVPVMRYPYRSNEGGCVSLTAIVQSWPQARL